MVSYGNIYEFAFDSQNGADFLIVVSKKDYSGEVTRRPLGRAPVLKRENNGHIYGTSLEIYAECTVEGEYAQFYTSDAFEFRVQLYKNGSLLWMGYVSPELYSEPDVAPPYDVQIIATDSLGELKNYTFTSDGPDSLLNHLNHILGMSLSYQMISDLRYEKSSGAMSNSSSEVMNVRIDLGHEDGENCYDVLQRLLESFNLNITQYNERWLLFRHADLINLASSDGVIAYDSSGNQVLLDIARFGSMNECEWWPVGQMSAVIEPARKKVTVQSPNHYKGNALSASDWDMSNGAIYDSTAGAYILPDEGSNIVQRLDFQEEVGYRLALRVRAMNVGTGNEDQGIGIMLKVNAHVASGYVDYYLLQHEETDRGVGSYYWYTKEGWIEGELAVPMSSDTSSDAQDIDIIIPLYDSRDQGFGTTSWIYARSIEVTIFNPQGTHDIHVYDVQLSKYDRSEGYQSDVTINNGAREKGDDIEMSLTDGSTVPAAGSIFMTGVPMEYPSAVITKWVVGDDTPDILLNTISKDYAREVALPRMRYTGSLNVPKGMTIPVLFIRDNTFYFPNTYSYDLWNDEVEVDLISVPAAEVSIASSVISQMASSGASSSGGSGSGGGGGIGTGIDLSGFARKDDLTALSELLASMWSIDPDTGVLTTDKDVVINGNLIVKKNSASGGTNDPSTNIGTVDHIVVNGKPYYPDNAGIVDLSEAFKGLSGGGIESITKQMVIDALQYTPLSTEGGTLAGTLMMSGGNIQMSGSGHIVTNEVYPKTTDTYYLGSDSRRWKNIVTQNINGYTPIHSGNIRSQHVTYAEKLTTGTYQYVTFDATNKYVALGDFAAKSGGYATYIDGSNIYLRVNGGNTIGLSIDSSGNVIIEKNLIVKGNSASGGTSGSNVAYVNAALKLVTSSEVTVLSAETSNGVNYITNNGCLFIKPTTEYSYDQGIRIGCSTSQQISAIWLNAVNQSGYDAGMWGITCAKGGNLRFRGGASSAADIINLTQSGEVLVGATTSQNYKFYVNGTSRFAERVCVGKDVAQQTSGRSQLSVVSTTDLPCDLILGTNAPHWSITARNSTDAGSAGPYGFVIYSYRHSSYRLYIKDNGYVYTASNFIAGGSVTQNSDMRIKNKRYDYLLDLQSIANAPLFAFHWNNGLDADLHIGTSAQYWEAVTPQLVLGDKIKSLDYSTLGVAMGISLAKTVLSHEDRIKALESKNKALKQQLNEISNGSVC